MGPGREAADKLCDAQGSAHLFRQLQADLAKHMQEFERAALRTSLNVPAGLILNQADLAEDGPSFTAEDEQRVDSQLSKLRQEIQEVLAWGDFCHKNISGAAIPDFTR